MKGYLCYMYEDTDGFHYLSLDNLDCLTDKTKGDHVLYKRRVNIHSTIGAIVEHEFDGDSVVHSRGPVISTWGNPVDVMAWKERQRQYVMSKTKINALEKISVKNACMLLNMVYHELNYAQRSAFIYKIIENITK